MAFDAKRNRIVLYGGRTWASDRQVRELRDTWEWDSVRWTLADSAGPERIHMVLAYDPLRRDDS